MKDARQQGPERQSISLISINTDNNKNANFAKLNRLDNTRQNSKPLTLSDQRLYVTVKSSETNCLSPRDRRAE